MNDDHKWVDRAPSPDLRTITGSYKIVQLHKQGKWRRADDKPLWYVVGYHVVKAVIQIASAIAILSIAKSCGLSK